MLKRCIPLTKSWPEDIWTLPNLVSSLSALVQNTATNLTQVDPVLSWAWTTQSLENAARLNFSRILTCTGVVRSHSMQVRHGQGSIFRGLAIIGNGNVVHDCYWIFRRYYYQAHYLLKTCWVFSHQLSVGSPGLFDPMLSCSYSCCSEPDLWGSFLPKLSYALLIICLGRSCHLDD